MKTMEGVRVCSLTHSTLRVKWRARVPGWVLRRMTIKLIIHMDLQKSNHKLVSVWLEHFWCLNEPWAYIDS